MLQAEESELEKLHFQQLCLDWGDEVNYEAFWTQALLFPNKSACEDMTGQGWSHEEKGFMCKVVEANTDIQVEQTLWSISVMIISYSYIYFKKRYKYKQIKHTGFGCTFKCCLIVIVSHKRQYFVSLYASKRKQQLMKQ